LDTNRCTRELNATFSAKDNSVPVPLTLDIADTRTSDTAHGLQFTTQRTVAIYIKIIPHIPTIAKQTETSTLFPVCEDLMAIVPLLGIHERFLVVLPESLNALGALILVPHVITERPLDSGCHIMPVSVPHGFQREKLEARQRIVASMKTILTVSGFLMKAFVTPICHSSFAIPVSMRILSHPLRASPVHV